MAASISLIEQGIEIPCRLTVDEHCGAAGSTDRQARMQMKHYRDRGRFIGRRVLKRQKQRRRIPART
jgi:hypothetical protein